MTPEQQRIAIAKVCGWKWYRRPATGPWAKKPYRSLYHPMLNPEYTASLIEADMTERQCNEVFIWREGMIPDYLNDPNAMREAETVLSKIDQTRFVHFLENIVSRDPSANLWSWALLRATASQRAEAFLKTLNLWVC